MISRHTRTEVPFTAQQMYRLVADIEAYPKFLPWCTALRVISRDVRDGAGTLGADMVVAYNVFRERFRCKVLLDPAQNTIDAHYIDGPFKKLSTRWQFTDRVSGGSSIDFFIEFEFKNVLLQTTAQMVFEKAFSKMSEAFVARAHQLYGAPSSSTEAVSPVSRN